MTTIGDITAAQLSEAMDILARRGNATDKMVFDSLTNHIKFRADYVSSVGVRHKRTRVEVASDARLSDELALILSYSLGLTPAFWAGAALTAATNKKAA